ncbi:MFS general substrate transporter [Mycena indigotica]|uniref:MFS general substrate transporter n=1 Tax=Mycena indigotica TaxID=2126181 RepID=A0A8H6TB09_9AGAR|nr:MFS general substrate transporter [Mycena indigotica]KAF7315208.1 MFS general substrate transporter [Mycena indigotica]
MLPPEKLWCHRRVTHSPRLMYIHAWQEYQDKAEALYAASPNNTRYCVKWRGSDGKLVLKITDNTTCLKFKTSSSVFLNRFEALNLALIQKMQNRRQQPTTTSSETPAADTNTTTSTQQPAAAASGAVPTAAGPASGGVKKKKPKKKKYHFLAETTMSLEDTPLLASAAELAHEAVYSRFTPSRKRIIVSLVSSSAILPMFASGSFIPSIPQIAKDLDTTGEVVSFAVSISIIGAALGAMIFATYSGFYGRRPMYLCGLPFLCFGSLGVALSRTVSQLLVFRFIQAFGTSGGFAVGAGVIGDIYKLTERGTAMGIFFSASLVGNAISPIVGGWGAKYSSWRNVQLGLFVAGLLVYLGMLTQLPETSHPGTLGIEKLDAQQTNSTRRKSRWVWLNPFACMYLLRGPNLLLVTVAGFTVLYTDYALLIPIAYTLGKRYDITNEAIIGALFFPMGVGNILGAPLAGIIADRMVIKWRKLRNGVWVPEDRLRATLWGGATLVPLSIVLSGLITHYIPGPLGLTLNLVCFFFNGLGVDLVLSPSAAYFVDAVHSRSAEIMAATVGLRSFLLSAAISGVLPSLHRFGLVATNTAVGLLAWAGVGLLWLTIRFGGRMRKWVDVGYSTIETT